MIKLDYSHFKHDGVNYYAGDHLHVDIFGAYNISDIEFVENTLKESILVAGGTILSSHFHHFGNGGVTGILVLSESHASFHGWEEAGSFAAIDIFMCGDANPSLAIPVLEKWFTPSKMIITHHKRGIV